MLRVKYKPFMLSIVLLNVVMLNVVMLSAMAPLKRFLKLIRSFLFIICLGWETNPGTFSLLLFILSRSSTELELT